MTMTSQRVTHLYELMDSAYDADGLLAHSQKLNHVPIVAPNHRRGTRKPSQLPKVFPVEPAPELTWAQQDRFKERTMIERVNGRLKDEFGASHLRVRGAAPFVCQGLFRRVFQVVECSYYENICIALKGIVKAASFGIRRSSRCQF